MDYTYIGWAIGILVLVFAAYLVWPRTGNALAQYQRVIDQMDRTIVLVEETDRALAEDDLSDQQRDELQDIRRDLHASFERQNVIANQIAAQLKEYAETR